MSLVLHLHELHVQVKDISGKLPGKHWHHCYLAHHKKSIHTHKPWNLDPKHAQNFDKITVKGYFDLQEGLNKKYNGISTAHNWNMDENGAQMGGDQNGDGSKFIFATEDHSFYCQHSDNIELVTILKCINAAGAMMSPYFVLKEGPLPDGTDPRLEGME
ncbi:hypothetical protein BDR04DRAFT_1140523, partial [Suillus decipiens]